VAQAIKTLGNLPADPIGWQAYVAGADAAADVNGIDLTKADYWFVRVKLVVKTSTGAITARLFMSDASNGTGNVHYITGVNDFGSSLTGCQILQGMGNIAQRYLNIDVTLGAAGTFDYEVFATPVATRG
jgi:hypothetical protein